MNIHEPAKLNSGECWLADIGHKPEWTRMQLTDAIDRAGVSDEAADAMIYTLEHRAAQLTAESNELRNFSRKRTAANRKEIIMSRFTQLPTPPKGSRFVNLRERIEAPLPGEEALVPSQDPKYAKRLPEFRPQVRASSAKATASVAHAPVASVKTKAPVKTAFKTAAEAYAERAAKVMGSPATIGKAKAAANLLGNTKCSADQIIKFLATEVPTDAERERAEQAAMWKRAMAKANAMAGFNDEPAGPENALQSGWAKALAKVNALNGFGGAA